MSGVLEFVALARSIRRYRDLIHNTLDHGLSNARSEATNTHLRALTKRAPRLRIPQPRRTYRHGHAHPRRPLPTTTRPNRMNQTHGNVSRSPKALMRPISRAVSSASSDSSIRFLTGTPFAFPPIRYSQG